MARKQAVYIHCHGGKGRSVVVVLAWMIKTCNINRMRAYNQLRKQRKIAKVCGTVLHVILLSLCMPSPARCRIILHLKCVLLLFLRPTLHS